MPLNPSVLDDYTYLDLEVDGHDQIFSYGLLSLRYELKVGPNQTEAIHAPLLDLTTATDLLCGHNIRRFDWLHLVNQWPDLASRPVAHALIDTLELSVLAFALAPSHKLGKHYKLSDYASNDPLEDARATRLLLEKCLDQFDRHPTSLRQLYVWLITHGNTAADAAYCQLFSALGWLPDLPPALADLPTEALAETAWAGLEDLPDLKNLDADFDSRLTLAALVVWNFERRSHRFEPGDSSLKYSVWLEHLPPFPTVRDQLFPLQDQEFTYQPFLEEFGIPGFQSIQEEAVQAIIARKNPLILMPTGGGKSLCYQLPALMHYRRQWGLTVCLSPLQALMEDQVADLEAKGLDFATFINGNLPAELRNERLEALRHGRKGLLYISPEQLRSISISTLLRDRLPALWVIDEAHCISQWGQDFRPDYRYIPKFIRELYTDPDRERNLPALALLTATATAQVRQDIRNIFAAQEIDVWPADITTSLQRDNLNFQVIPVNGHKEPRLVEAIQRATAQGGCALIYTTTRRRAEQLAARLSQRGIPADHYHGKIPKEKKAEVLKAFKAGELNVVSATCAFGMGINRKDVRLVIHDTPSGSLENYLQEAGRAGRDSEPADCTLLFDPADVDMLFSLKSLGHLSEIDLRNIFETLRGLRNRAHPGNSTPKDDWFWVTADEFYQTSTLDDNFGKNDEQRGTKIRVALHHLEDFGLIERAENRSTVVKFKLKKPTPRQSWQTFIAYNRNMDFKKSEIKQFERLIYAIHLLEQHHQDQGNHLSMERLSDESGIAIPDLPGRIRELQRAGVCTSKVPLTLLITKGVRGDAKSAYERYRDRENTLLTYLAEKVSDKDSYILNPRKLATFFDPQNKQKLQGSDLTNILTGWQSLGWVSLRQRSGGLLEIKAPKSISENDENPEIQSEFGPLSQVIEWLPRHQSLCERLINALYARIDAKSDEKTGARLVVQCDFEDLLEAIYGRLLVTEEEAKSLRKILIWLHQQSILRLTDGLTLFQQALKVRTLKGASKGTIKHRYPNVEKHYREQSRKIHVMARYGELVDDEQARQALVEDYFKIPPEEFGKKYPDLIGDTVERPLTQADYEKIMGPLNEIQRNIVETEDSAISVIAGPGSGKTRTIVHRIAYLIKVKRLPPDRILVLAYNRNAVRELRIRLRELIGDHASRLQVFTFHGLALKLLGRILEKSSSFQQGEKDANQPFKDLLEEACNLLEANNSDDDTEDIQFRRIQMLGNLEHIFVDEYQDVTEQEYRLIRLLSGLELEDESEQTETILGNEAPGGSEEGLSEKKPKATADKQNRQKNTTTPSLPINLCVIGDDDQNIYSFRGTNTRFILQFEAEYKAKQFLLTENYRSTESIIAVSNRVIQNNQLRCKQLPQEQVSINRDRKGTVGAPVRAFLFSTSTAQAIWITQQVQQWLEDGVAPNEIAVLAREWDHLNEIRALLERLAGVPTYALKGREVKLIRQAITHELLKKFQQDPNLTLQKDESVQGRFQSFFRAANRDPKEPTVKMLLKIAEDLDRERSLGSEDLAIPITAAEIATSIYEFSESPNNSLVNEDAVLVTSCHGAKGLEFSKVIVLTDQFPEAEHRIDDERRLFYVSLTRAKDELVLCGQKSSRFLQETELQPTIEALNPADLPSQIYYFDLTPQDVNLGYRKALQSERQRQILALREGDPLKLVPNQYGDGWLVLTERGFVIGALSQKCNKTLSWKGLRPGHVQFQPGEVTVRHVYHHVDRANDSDEILGDWYVVIPQIRVYRGS